MNIEFLAADPRLRARPRLEEILRRGVDQLAIACAFCTPAGVAILSNHTARLGKPDSFVVVAAAPPTDYGSLRSLYSAIPNNLFVHWGALAPWEIKGGAPLMHSKVFYARADRECWLWTGSHNLTANATQGANCEAAILVHGDVDEQPFRDAMQHLLACRAAATPYDPDALPPGMAEDADVLVIHAEGDPNQLVPLPSRGHLCLNSSQFDKLLTAPAEVRLFLYRHGTLFGGWQNTIPIAAFQGLLTGQNLTSQNPNTGSAGTDAQWGGTNFNIIDASGVLALAPPGAPGPSVTTQAPIFLNARSNVEESLFSEEPRVESKPIPGESQRAPVDSDMRGFYRRAHVQGTMLVHVPVVGRRQVIKVPWAETREGDFAKLRMEIAEGKDLPIEVENISDEKLERRHPFILRAKFRLREELL